MCEFFIIFASEKEVNCNQRNYGSCDKSTKINKEGQ